MRLNFIVFRLKKIPSTRAMTMITIRRTNQIKKVLRNLYQIKPNQEYLSLLLVHDQ